MPKIPDNPSPFPKKKYHYGTDPKIRVDKTIVMQAMWENKVVKSRYSGKHLHIAVFDRTLCGLRSFEDLRNGSRASWREVDDRYRCQRCDDTMKKIRTYYDEVNK